MTIISIPVFVTGEPAEEFIEKLPGVSKALLDLHEDAAGFAIWLVGITGLVALFALYLAWKNSRIANRLYIIAFVCSAFCFTAMARTGYLGGKIRHPEVRSNTAAGIDNQLDNENKDKGKEDD